MLRLLTVLIILATFSQLQSFYIFPVTYKQSITIHPTHLIVIVIIKALQDHKEMLVLTLENTRWLQDWLRSWWRGKISETPGTTPGERSRDGVSYSSHHLTTGAADWVTWKYTYSGGIKVLEEVVSTIYECFDCLNSLTSSYVDF